MSIATSSSPSRNTRPSSAPSPEGASSSLTSATASASSAWPNSKRLSQSRRPWPGSYRAFARHTAKEPPARASQSKPGALAQTAGFSLPADLEAGSTTRGAGAAVTAGDNLDPGCILVLVVRGGAGLTQRIQAVLRRTRGCGGESRQLKDHPRAGIQFRQGEGHGWPFGGHLDLGTGSYVGARYVVLLAIAAENDWRLRSSTRASAASATQTAIGCARTTGAPVTRARTASYRGPALTSARTGTCATSEAAESTSSETAVSTWSSWAANIQASNIALAHSSVPSGLDLTSSCVGCDAVVDAVIDENVGIGTTTERAVLVANHRGLIGRTTEIIAAPLPLHRWEIHRLGVDEFHVVDGVVGADPEAGKHQVRHRSRLASGVVLEIP